MNQGVVTREALQRLPLKRVARDLLAEAIPFADSGLETYLRARLQWLGVPLSATRTSATMPSCG